MNVDPVLIYPLLVIIHVGIIVVVYHDARFESRASAVFWALVVFFTGFIIGGVLYYVLGPPRKRRKRSTDGSDHDEPMNVDRSGPF